MSYESGMLGIELYDYPDARADDVLKILNIRNKEDARAFVMSRLARDEKCSDHRFIENIRKLGRVDHRILLESTSEDDVRDWEKANEELLESGKIRKKDDGYYSWGYLSDEDLADVMFDISNLMRMVVEIEKTNNAYTSERRRGFRCPAPERLAYESLGLKLEKSEGMITAFMSFVLSEGMYSILAEEAAIEAIEDGSEDVRSSQPLLDTASSSLLRVKGKEIKDNAWYLPFQKDYVENLDDEARYPLLRLVTRTEANKDMGYDNGYVDASDDWSDKLLAVNLPNLGVSIFSRRPQIGANNDYAALWLALLDSFSKVRLLCCDYCGKYIEASARKRTNACGNCTKTRQRYLKYKEESEAEKSKPKKQRRTEEEIIKKCGLGPDTIARLRQREEELGRPLQ